MLNVSLYCNSIIAIIFDLYVFNYIVRNKKFRMDFKTIVFILVLAIIIFMVKKTSLVIIQPLLVHLVIIISLKYFYKEKLVSTIISVILTATLTIIVEVIVALLILFFHLEVLFKNLTPLNLFISNFSILFLSYLIFSISIIKKFYIKVIYYCKKCNYIFIIAFGTVVLSFGIYISYKNLYIKQDILYLLFSNLFFLAAYIFLMSFFNEKSNNNKLKEEYNHLIDYTKIYEKTLNEKSKENHEHKNQLVIIKNMIEEHDSRVIEYIYENLEYESSLNDINWLRKLKNIPKGGLKGLIYYKIEKMKEKNINVLVEVSEIVSDDSVWEQCNNNLYDISRSIGVFLDNAIEATKGVSNKNIIISIDYIDLELMFKISNTFKDFVNLNKISKIGFSTKGKGRGQGLALVDELVSKNINIRKETEINGDFFIQKLYIK